MEIELNRMCTEIELNRLFMEIEHNVLNRPGPLAPLFTIQYSGFDKTHFKLVEF